jgi:glycerol uptake facilitator-like aquaporin
VKLSRILVEFLLATFLSLYILIISINSPCPPFNNQFGGIFIVFSWVFSSCLFIRVRCLTAARLESHGQNALLIYGLITIIGQIIGGILIYLLVDVFRLFIAKSKCTIIKCE